MVKYFLKLNTVKKNNCILSVLLTDQINTLHNNNDATNWISKVRDIIQSTGFNDVWLFPESVNIHAFVPVLRNRLRDIYVNNWRVNLEASTALDIYREIKITFEQSSYIKTIENVKLRNVIAKLRLSSHNLNIEVGRHHKIPRGERKCSFCNLNDIEDEFHFVLKCPVYADLRRQYLPRYYYTHTSIFKYINLLQTENKNILKKLALFCIKAFKLRDSLL